MKKGEDFELLVSALEKQLCKDPSVRVEHNVRLQTKKGNYRTVDVLIEQVTERFTFRTIIECKDKMSKVKAVDVNAFKTLLDNLNAHQGIIVSKSGYQSGAIIEAKNERILLHTLSQIDETILYLRSALICQYQYYIRHVSTEINFLEKKSINKDVNLHSPLRSDGTSQCLSIADVMEHHLNKEKETIPNHFMKNIKTKDGMITVTDGELSSQITFKRPVYYENDGIKSYIKGFTSQCKVEFQLTNAQIEKVRKYHDISNNNTIAIITDVDVNGEKVSLIENVSKVQKK
jgi:hypothetical protein